MRLTDITVSVAIALAVTTALFALRRNEPIDADEGYLWYGTQRVVAGELPVRDFRSYEPGRYFWCAAALRVRGDRLSVLRGASHAFFALAMVAALCALQSAGLPAIALGASAVAIGAWAFPQYKLFEPAIALLTFAAGFVLLADPRPAAAVLGGAAVGLAALFGFNLFLYAAASITVMLGWSMIESGASPDLSGWMVLGAIALSLPLTVLLVVSRPFRNAFVQRRIITVLRRGSSNLPMSVPLPWRPPATAVRGYSRWRRWVFGLLFVVVAVLPVALFVGLALDGASPNDEPMAAARVAAATTGLLWWHHAYSRADVPHLAQAVLPALLLGLLAGSPGAWSIAVCSAAAIGSIALNIADLLLVSQRTNREQYVRRLVRGEWITLRVDQERLLDRVDSVRGPGDECVMAVPLLAWVYPVLGLRAPIYDIFCVYPASIAEQERMLAEVRRAGVNLIVVHNTPLDDRDDLRFSSTHPLVWEHVQADFVTVQSPDLVSDIHVFQRMPSE